MKLTEKFEEILNKKKCGNCADNCHKWEGCAIKDLIQAVKDYNKEVVGVDEVRIEYRNEDGEEKVIYWLGSLGYASLNGFPIGEISQAKTEVRKEIRERQEELL